MKVSHHTSLSYFLCLFYTQWKYAYKINRKCLSQEIATFSTRPQSHSMSMGGNIMDCCKSHFHASCYKFADLAHFRMRCNYINLLLWYDLWLGCTLLYDSVLLPVISLTSETCKCEDDSGFTASLYWYITRISSHLTYLYDSPYI